MNKKSLRLMILAVIASTTFSTVTVFADKPDFSNKNTNKFEQTQGNSNNQYNYKKQNNFNKKSSKEIFIINQRLNHIETSLNEINARMDEYFNKVNNPSPATTGSSIENGTQPQSSTGQTGDTVAPNSTTTDTTTDVSTTTDPSTTTNTTTPTDVTTNTAIDSSASTTSSAADTQQTTSSDTTTAVTTTDTTPNTDATAPTDVTTPTTSSGVDTTSSDEDEQDLSGDFEKDYKDEDSNTSNSFYGKLNAVMNRLNTVKRQLTRIGSTDDPQIIQLNTITDDLINKVKASIAKLSSIQQQNVDGLKNKASKREMKSEDINEQKRTWEIHFTKEVKTDTINSQNILVIDSGNNIIDTNISYNSNTNEVTIEAKDGFKKGESYTILISDNVQSIDGKKLKTPIVKNFTVK